jgi:predicted secreted protein
MSGEVTGIGTEFRRWNSTTQLWVPLANVKNISGPGMSRTVIDTTNLSTAGGYRTFIAGLRTPGSITFTMAFNRDAYDLMKADFESDVLQNYEIVLPDAEETSIEFEGLVTELPLTIPADDVITANVTIQISGVVTFDSGSGPSPT